MAIIRRACSLSGITLKLTNLSNNKSDTIDNLNIRLNSNIKLTIDNISSLNIRFKTMKAETKDLMSAMQEAYDNVHLSFDHNRKMYGIKIMLNLIEESRQIFGT